MIMTESIIKDRIITYQGDEYGIRKAHNLLLLLLEKLDDHCKFYGLSYSLAYGSMLGCVREKGFIPWDDDVDIVMKRKDYDRFFSSLEEGKTQLSKDCFVESPVYMKKLHDKTTGDIPVFVDLYAADSVPNNWLKRRIKYVVVQFVKEVIKGRQGRRNLLPGMIHSFRRIIAYCISFPFSNEQIRRLYTKVATWGNGKDTTRLSSYCSGYKSYGKYYPAEIYENIQYLPFEDIKMPVVGDYDLYLSKEYGQNYMTPPPQSKRNPVHIKKYKQNRNIN